MTAHAPPFPVWNREIEQALDFWEGKRQGRRYPLRSEIDPVDMRRWLGSALLAEVRFGADDTEPEDFYFRVAGGFVCERYGCELTRRWLSSIDLNAQRSAVFETFRQTVRSATPVYSIASFVKADGQLRTFEMLLLPLSADGTRCDMLLGAVMPIPPGAPSEDGVWSYTL
jgi:hypothetical protein